jgi:hypothetical protein
MDGTGGVQVTISIADADGGATVQQVIANIGEIGPAGEAAGAQASAGLAQIEESATKAQAAVVGLSASWKSITSPGAMTASNSTLFQSFFGQGSEWTSARSAIQAIPQEIDQVGAHALTSLDNVRLLRDDLGIRIPRSMEKAIASSQLLSGAIGMIGPGLLAIGAADIFVHIGEALYNAYEKYIDINAAQDEFLKTMEENKDKDFINVHSIETAKLRLDEATASMIALKGAAEAENKGGWLDILANLGNPGAMSVGLGELLTGRQLAGAAAKSAAQTQELSPEEQALQHQQNISDIDYEHAGDSELKGQAKITAELQKQVELDKEKQRYTSIEEKERGNSGAKDAGKYEQANEDMGALKKAMAEETELHRQETQQIIEMQNEATNAGLEGNALRAAQEQQAIDAIVRKYQEGEIDKQTASAETAAVQQKFAAEAAKLQQQLDEQTKHMADEAAQAGLKGQALLAAQLKTQLDAIDTAEQKAVGPGGTETSAQSADYNSQRDSARQESYQKGVEEQTQYEDKIQSLMQRSDDFELQGYARIDADRIKSLNSLAEADNAYYSDLGAAMTAFAQQAVQVEADADRQRQQLHQRTMEQITKEEQQTARLLLPEWQQAQLAIEDTYTDRLHQIEQDVKQHVMTEQEGAAAVTAAWQQAAAQMEKAEEEARDKIAGGLQQLFTHPEKFFEESAMKTGFQLMANEMLSVFQSSGQTGGILQYLFGMGPQMSTSTNPLTAIESALGLGNHNGSQPGSTPGNPFSTMGSATNPSMIQFSQGSTTLLTGSQTLLQAAASLQSAAGSMSIGGGGNTLGFPGGGGGLGIGGSSSSTAASAGGGYGSLDTTTPDLSGTIGADGTFTSSTASQAATMGATAGPLGAAGGIVGGGLMGAMSIYSAYQNSNPIAGAAGGAMGGMEMGAALGSVIPGLGTVVGGAIGAIAGGLTGLFAGIFGDQGKGQAEGLDVNTIQPEITKDMQDYEAGRSGYSAVAMDLTNMMTSARNSTGAWGSGARNYFSSNIEPEINAALQSLQKQEMGGRSAVTLSAAQYHNGGWTGDFGDMATSDTEGFIHAMRDEFVVNPMAAQAHAPILQAMNSGTMFGAVQPRMPAASGNGSNLNLTIQALDSKSVATWAKTGGGKALMAALNQANGQYSGIGRG